MIDNILFINTNIEAASKSFEIFKCKISKLDFNVRLD